MIGIACLKRGGRTFEQLGDAFLQVDPHARVASVLIEQPEVVLLHQVETVAHFAQKFVAANLSLKLIKIRYLQDLTTSKSYL